MTSHNDFDLYYQDQAAEHYQDSWGAKEDYLSEAHNAEVQAFKNEALHEEELFMAEVEAAGRFEVGARFLIQAGAFWSNEVVIRKATTKAIFVEVTGPSTKNFNSSIGWRAWFPKSALAQKENDIVFVVADWLISKASHPQDVVMGRAE